MRKINKFYLIGLVLQIIPLFAIGIAVFYIFSSFDAVAGTSANERAVILNHIVRNSLWIIIVSLFFGFIAFVYPFIMLRIGQNEIANKLRKAFFILGIFSFWGGLLPLAILICTKRYFEPQKDI
jgi:hypothetical protein